MAFAKFKVFIVSLLMVTFNFQSINPQGSPSLELNLVLCWTAYMIDQSILIIHWYSIYLSNYCTFTIKIMLLITDGVLSMLLKSFINIRTKLRRICGANNV